MSQPQDILARFNDALARDKKHIKKWMIEWAHQDRRKFRKYAEGLPQDFYVYRGTDNLIEWFNWMTTAPRPSYLPLKIVERLVETSRTTDIEVFERLGHAFPNEELYDQSIAVNNTIDFHLPHCYPVPERQQIRSMLDFGAGYGRQANLWLHERPDLTYVAVDGIPLSYCAQHLYYTHLGHRFADYVVDPKHFSVRVGTPGIFHLPTWRLDLIQNDSLDLVSCVQVLPELSRKLLQYVLHQFHRILKPGGALYIRDHDRQWRPGHGINTSRLLLKLGFELEFHPQVIDREEVWGVPRVWRKAHPDVEQSRQRSVQGVVRDWTSVIDGWTGGRLRQYARRLRQMS